MVAKRAWRQRGSHSLAEHWVGQAVRNEKRQGDTTVARTNGKDQHSRPALRSTSRTTSHTERRSGEPTAEDMTDPREVWKDAETTPQEHSDAAAATGHGRVADAGDVGAGSTKPYGLEKQSDMVAKQTDRGTPPGSTRKPARTKR
jgi:hypothetical protein